VFRRRGSLSAADEAAPTLLLIAHSGTPRCMREMSPGDGVRVG